MTAAQSAFALVRPEPQQAFPFAEEGSTLALALPPADVTIWIGRSDVRRPGFFAVDFAMRDDPRYGRLLELASKRRACAMTTWAGLVMLAGYLVRCECRGLAAAAGRPVSPRQVLAFWGLTEESLPEFLRSIDIAVSAAFLQYVDLSAPTAEQEYSAQCDDGRARPSAAARGRARTRAAVRGPGQTDVDVVVVDGQTDDDVDVACESVKSKSGGIEPPSGVAALPRQRTPAVDELPRPTTTTREGARPFDDDDAARIESSGQPAVSSAGRRLLPGEGRGACSAGEFRPRAGGELPRSPAVSSAGGRPAPVSSGRPAGAVSSARVPPAGGVRAFDATDGVRDERPAGAPVIRTGNGTEIPVHDSARAAAVIAERLIRHREAKSQTVYPRNPMDFQDLHRAVKTAIARGNLNELTDVLNATSEWADDGRGFRTALREGGFL